MAVIRIRKKDRGNAHETGCLLCGSPLVYGREAVERTCALCGEKQLSACACTQGHYVCDRCHTAGLEAGFIPLLLQSRETDPQALLEEVFALPGVHMHGPEHHAIVPCVLLAACRNCGGSLDLPSALGEALKRGSQVPAAPAGTGVSAAPPPGRGSTAASSPAPLPWPGRYGTFPCVCPPAVWKPLQRPGDPDAANAPPVSPSGRRRRSPGNTWASPCRRAAPSADTRKRTGSASASGVRIFPGERKRTRKTERKKARAEKTLCP